MSRRAMGVRARLFLAIGAIAGSTVVASVAAVVLLARVGAEVDRVTGTALPNLVASTDLAASTGSLVAEGEKLLSATTHGQRRRRLGALEPLRAAVDRDLKQISELQGGAADTQVAALIAKLDERLKELNDAVAAQIDTVGSRRLTTNQIATSHGRAVAALQPLVARARAEMAQATANADGDPATAGVILETLVSRDIPMIEAMSELGAGLNLAAAQLSLAGARAATNELDQARRDFAALAERIETSVRAVEVGGPEADLRDAVSNFIATGRGAGNVFDRFDAEMKAARQAASVYAAAVTVGGELSEALKQQLAQSAEIATASGAATSAAIGFGATVMAAIGAVSVLGAMLVMWLYVGRNLVRRIVGLETVMTRLAQGDLAAEPPRSNQSDEIARMAQALVQFRDGIVKSQALAAEQEAEQAAKAARGARLEQLVRHFEAQAGATVATVSAAAGQLQATAESMAGITETTTTQSAAMAGAAAEAGSNVAMVAAAAEELSASIQEIARQVGRSAEMAGQAAGDARRTDEVVHALAEGARKIGDVVGLISDIAGQTNLLALNATIEAARAGDAGKGFAVVASEVKNLAGQTARATDDIARQIAEIQNATLEAVQAISGITATIGEVNNIASSIATAVEQQGAATQEIARNVQHAAEGTRLVTESIASVTDAAQQTGVAAGQLLAASGNLTSQASTLRDEMSQFAAAVKVA